MSDTTNISLFQRGNILGVLFLTIDVLVKILEISLYITNQVVHIKVLLLPDISFDFSSLLKVSNFALIFVLPDFFAFACVAFFLPIFLLIAGVIQGTEETERLVLMGYAYQPNPE